MRRSLPSRPVSCFSSMASFLALSAVLLLSTTTTVITAFQATSPIPASPITSRTCNALGSHHATSKSRQSKMILYTSLTVPPGMSPPNFQNDDDGDKDQDKKSQQGTGVHINIVKNNNKNEIHDHEDDHEDTAPLQQILPKNTNEKPKQKQKTGYAGRKSSFNPFLAHLTEMRCGIKNPKYLAYCMDDELKRMESHAYRLEGEDLPTIRYPQTVFAFDGPILYPPIQAYEQVARAYAKGKLGSTGAALAEEVVARFMQHHPDQRPSSKLLNYVLKAWIAADDLDNVEFWLFRIEELHKNTHKTTSHHVYLPLLEGLNDMKTDRKKRIANLSISVIEKTRDNYAADPEHNYLPSKEMYMAALLNVRDSKYTGEYRFDRGEQLVRYQLEDYKTYKIASVKPTATEAVPAFIFAGKCSFPRHNVVIEKTEKLLNEFVELYKETGDPDFRPVPKMYERIASMHARMSRRKNAKAFADRTFSMLDDMKDLGVQFESPRTGSAVLNRIMKTAEDLMPKEPMENPVRSRDMFTICLDAFKRLHSYGKESDFNVQPNSSSYEIFLRAVGKLPEGKARSDLSSKAFHHCRQRGLVNQEICQKLYDANPALALSELGVTREEFIDQFVDIPESWRKNVVSQTKNGVSNYKVVHTWDRDEEKAS